MTKREINEILQEYPDDTEVAVQIGSNIYYKQDLEVLTELEPKEGRKWLFINIKNL